MRTRLSRQPGTVGQQFFNRDRRIVRLSRLNLKPRQIFRDGIVKPELAGIAQLHDRGGGEQLAVRCHAEFRRRCDGCPALDIGVTEALRPDQFLVVHDADGDSRQLAISHLAAYPAFKQPLRACHIGMIRNARMLTDGQRKKEYHVQCVPHRVLV